MITPTECDALGAYDEITVKVQINRIDKLLKSHYKVRTSKSVKISPMEFTSNDYDSDEIKRRYRENGWKIQYHSGGTRRTDPDPYYMFIPNPFHTNALNK